MKSLAIYPGSFDPVTNGHLDILQRALRVFDRVVIAVAENGSKNSLFSPEERCSLLRQLLKHEERVEVDHFTGLLVDYTRRRGTRHVVRGLRAVADFEYEFQLALMNRRLEKDFDTVFLMTDESHMFISSQMVKEISRLGGDVSAFVPKAALDALAKKRRG